MAIRRDGTVVSVKEPEITNLSDVHWPEWSAVQLDPILNAAPEIQSAMALQDGQVLVGGFEPVGQDLWWRNAFLGAIRLDLEKVAWIGPAFLFDAPAGTRDQVQFVNGDRAEGFVQSIDTSRGLRLETLAVAGKNESSTQDHDLERIAAIRLASRPETSRGWRLWLRDGSVIDVDHWSREGDKATLSGFHLAGMPSTLSLPWIQIAAIRAPFGGPVPIASVPWKAIDSENSPRLTSARIHPGSAARAMALAHIDLYGPGRFEAQLPPGEWVMHANLVPPPGLDGKSDCTVVVLDGDREVARERVHPNLLAVAVHGRIQSGRLCVVIEDSRKGAFGAAVRLRDALLIPMISGSVGTTPARTSAEDGIPAAKTAP